MAVPYPVPPLPDHLLDLDGWCALGEDSDRRFELVEGVLQMAARPVLRHQQLILGLATQLRAAAHGRWQVVPEWEVVVDDGPAATVRVPDVVLVPPDTPGESPRLRGDEVLAVVEVVSPGSRRVDRVMKFHEYAEAGVPVYLLVEPGPPLAVTEFALVDGVYRGREGPSLSVLDATLDLEGLTDAG